MNDDSDGKPHRPRPNKSALQYAVKLLSTRPYSERKLGEKLTRRLFERDEVQQALLRLKRERLLDDEKFADDFVRTRLTSRPRATTALIRDLLARGIPMDIARKVVQASVQPGDEEELARDLIRRKWDASLSLDSATRRRRLGGLLARRGFSPEVIRKVLREFERSDPDE